MVRVKEIHEPSPIKPTRPNKIVKDCVSVHKGIFIRFSKEDMRQKKLLRTVSCHELCLLIKSFLSEALVLKFFLTGRSVYQNHSLRMSRKFIHL